MKAVPTEDGPQLYFEPPALEEVVAAIRKEKPDVVFMPHMETSTGILLPNDYVAAVSSEVHKLGSVLALDGVASGMLWVDMTTLGVDAYITAPQKGWTSPACAGIVMLSEAGNGLVSKTTSSSMSLNLRKWRDVMDAYLGGGFAYHTTMPTGCLQLFRDAAEETRDYGFRKAQEDFLELGRWVRALLIELGYKSVAAPGFEAPGVVVVHSSYPALVSKMAGHGMQLAAGVPLMLDEAELPAQRFRIGLFGIDKVYDVNGTVALLQKALGEVVTSSKEEL